jgi:hypothetical protein
MEWHGVMDFGVPSVLPLEISNFRLDSSMTTEISIDLIRAFAFGLSKGSELRVASRDLNRCVSTGLDPVAILSRISALSDCT